MKNDLQDLQAAFEAEPKNLQAARTYAEALVNSGHFEEALACWNRIEEIIPEDPEPAKMIAKLTIAKNRYQAVHGVPSEEPVKENKKQANKSSEGHRIVDTRNLYRTAKPKGVPGSTPASGRTPSSCPSAGARTSPSTRGSP